MKEFLSRFDKTLQRSLDLSGEVYVLIKECKLLLMEEFLGGPGPLGRRWPAVPLGELLASDGLMEGPAGNGLYGEARQEEAGAPGLPLITPETIKDLRYRDNGLRLPEGTTETHASLRVRGGDIVAASNGPLAGASALFPLFHTGGILGAGCLILRPDVSRCETFYLLNLLHYLYNRSTLKLYDGAARKLREFSVPLPPLPEQKEISGRLLDLSAGMVAQEEYRREMTRLKERISASS